MKIKFKKGKDFYSACVRNTDLTICCSGIQGAFEIPPNTKEFTLNITKKPHKGAILYKTDKYFVCDEYNHALGLLDEVDNFVIDFIGPNKRFYVSIGNFV